MDLEKSSSDLSGRPPEQARPRQRAKKTSGRAKAKSPVTAKVRKPQQRLKAGKKAGTQATKAPRTTRTPRRTVRKPAVTIPPILLEGDAPHVEMLKVPGETARPHKIQIVTEPTPRPERQPQIELEGTKEVMLVARDPHSLYAHWDLSGRQRREYVALSADGSLVLRVYAGEVGGRLVAQVKLAASAYDCFVDVPFGGARYQAELGYNDKAANWVRISTSAIVTTPPSESVALEPIKFATIPLETPLPESSASAAKAGLEHIPLPEMAEAMCATAVIQSAVPSHIVPETRSGDRELLQEPKAVEQGQTPEEQRGIGMSTAEPGRQIGSEAAIQIIRGAIEHGISSPGGEEEKGKQFWFNVNAELVIYGATEPDAQVTLGGLPVKLRPDGTFSYRIALPDGQHELVAEAVSADKKEKRTAHFSFTRLTKYTAERESRQKS